MGPTADVEHQPSTDLADHSFARRIGDSLRALHLPPAKVGAALLGLAAVLPGCSPQNSSYYFGSFTKLPPPPPEARMQLGVSTEEDGTVFVNYVVWNDKASHFERKDFHYTSKKLGGTMNFGDFAAAGGYQQRIHDGEVLYGNAIVDQKAGRIIMQGGNYIDGRTGNTYSADGTLLKAFSTEEK